MGTRQNNSRGFTLIAAMLMTVLLSGVAVGVLYMVSNEARMGGNDLEGNQAYYGAQAGIENLTFQLAQLYQTSQSPDVASLCALAAPATAITPTTISGSTVSNMQYTENITWPNAANVTTCPGTAPTGTWDIVGAGQDQGMVASMIPYTLSVTATRLAGAGQVSQAYAAAATGASVNISRTVEVALLPAFEFGIFCDGDCDYFAGPPFNFGGRVHTNGNLFLAANSGPLTFTDKIAAVGQVVSSQLENGNIVAAGNYDGSVYVPNAAGGCPAAPNSGPGAGGNCLALPAGSWTGGFPPTGAANGGWKTISKATFAGFIETGATGATKLQLPFVNGGDAVGAIDIIRRPQAADSTLLSNSRMYNMANIRILLADTIGDLHPERGAAKLDANDVQLVAGAAGYQQLAYTGAPSDYMYFATGTVGTNSWVEPTGCTNNPYPLMGGVTSGAVSCAGAWLRIEYCPAAANCQLNPGSWVGVTQQWLGYGFGRTYNMPPTAPYVTTGTPAPCPTGAYPQFPALNTGTTLLAQCYNPISPAIVILQQLQNNLVPAAKAYEADKTNTSNTAGNWMPINFYDAREGEPRDARPAGNTATTCSTNGVMNVVELDVGNLWLWLQGAAPYAGGNGKLVGMSTTGGGGYIVYFSDHRGMTADPNVTGNGLYNRITGMSGLEDVVNAASQNGVPDNAMEPITYYNTPPAVYSPEDVNADTFLDNWGGKYLGAGFGLAVGAANMSQAYYISGTTAGLTNCATNAEWNEVTGPRHGLRLVDAGMDVAGNSYLPHPAAGQTGTGFTVASEEPVYVLGDYNSGPADPFFPTSGANATTPHSAAAIIADAVTLLSNPPTAVANPVIDTGWTDHNSFLNPGTAGNRSGNTSYYRLAIAAGKSIPFPQPTWAGVPADFGTDGGMHNFLRYLENRGANSAVVNYAGSLISMYYSQYATGTFKCCNSVYGAPKRNYYFDTQFENPANLPPGTPEFEDIVNLSYYQSFTPQ